MSFVKKRNIMAEYYNKSLYTILNDDATWEDEALVERLQDAVVTGTYDLRCRTRYSQTTSGVSSTLITGI